jgi:beta-N-acetylhexosaminidase
MEKQFVVKNFGQLFILAFDGPKLTADLIEYFATFRIGGIILFKDNYEDAHQLKELVKQIQTKCTVDGVPMIICTDHEGGQRQEFLKGFTRIPPMASLSKESDEHIYALFRTIARELLAVGVNMNLAPVADMISPLSPGNIADRSFGVVAQRVAKNVVAAIRGMQSEGLWCCVKHFPGHGATPKSSHVELPVIDMSFDQLAEYHLLPFEAAIRSGVDAVMTGHLLLPFAGDTENPVTLSPFWIKEVLRNRLKFNGLIITDALEMKALLNKWTPFECGMRSIDAGSDLIIYYKEKTQFQTFYELREALSAGELDFNSVGQRVEKIMMSKNKLYVPD